MNMAVESSNCKWAHVKPTILFGSIASVTLDRREEFDTCRRATQLHSPKMSPCDLGEALDGCRIILWTSFDVIKPKLSKVIRASLFSSSPSQLVSVSSPYFCADSNVDVAPVTGSEVWFSYSPNTVVEDLKLKFYKYLGNMKSKITILNAGKLHQRREKGSFSASFKI
jgi:hypothetical protein